MKFAHRSREKFLRKPSPGIGKVGGCAGSVSGPFAWLRNATVHVRAATLPDEYRILYTCVRIEVPSLCADHGIGLGNQVIARRKQEVGD